MFSQFTDRARKVMELANQEAQHLRHEYIGTEHILLGLVVEGEGVAFNVLQGLRIDHRKVRREIEKILQCGPEPTWERQLPMTPRAKKVIEYAIDEARNLKHHYVATEHLLLGLVREIEGVASQVLMNLGLNLQGVRQEVVRILRQSQYVEDKGRTIDVASLTEDPTSEIESHLPEPVREIVKGFGCLTDVIEEEKQEEIASQDFERAAALRDLADKLKKLKADFIRQWPKEL